ncbi:hypothetical protein EMPS_06946 [Entomortierella parvispora]|uniref:Uncharacterized protein n=1 Tax=Entomortierella parvispora TaxID=205924 RepID=A0A9P3LXZ3_9FUNG|nr:hypothetical protein EMPS_06946 [Entomortierella parvispora]
MFDSWFFEEDEYVPPPKPIVLSAEIIDMGSKLYVKKIFEDWNLLNHIILRHEATIQKKWLKKSREQRRNTLLHAWPEMPKKHRPDMEVFLEEKSLHPSTNPAYLWPDINQEDLLKPKILPIFLNARARHYPSFFAGADADSFKFARSAGKVTPAFLHEHTMMFTGHNSSSTYGRLYSWEENDDAFEWQVSGRGVQGGLGLMVLKVQERVYRFLADCCLHILQMTREAAMADTTPIEPEPKAQSMIEGPVTSLSDIATATPYSVPAKLDLASLRELIAARRSDAEDHFWSLREDPSYFENAILQTKEHRQEFLMDIHGELHSLVSPHLTREFWRRVAHKVIMEAHCLLEVWHILLNQIDELMALLKKYEGQLKEESPLPKDLLNCFLDLEFSLGIYMDVPLHILKHIVVASPPLRAWFARKPEVHPLLLMEVVVKPYVSKDVTQMKLIWLLQALCDDQQRHHAGALPLLDMMERLVENDPKSRNLFSAKVSSTIGDYSLFAEVQRQIRLFQPWASTFDRYAAEREAISRSNYIKRTRRMMQVDEAFKSINTSAADPTDKKFYYPVDKRRTKENTLAMQKAERNLDKYWDEIDRLMLKTANDSKNGKWTCLLSSDRTLQRTPDWVEPAPAVSVQEKKKKEVQVEELMLGLELRSESTTDNNEMKQQQKEKVKTRGTAASAETSLAPETTEETDDSAPVDQEPTFKLDSRALKVFSTLFHQPSMTSLPGEIPWIDFLYAMRKMGFTETKMYGSVWHFSPVGTDLGRSIQIHEPHPSKKIPFNTARRIGRRLFRNYGWRGDMFVHEDPKA